jgi:hypothetical protein
MWKNHCRNRNGRGQQSFKEIFETAGTAFHVRPFPANAGWNAEWAQVLDTEGSAGHA